MPPVFCSAPDSRSRSSRPSRPIALRQIPRRSPCRRTENSTEKEKKPVKTKKKRLSLSCSPSAGAWEPPAVGAEYRPFGEWTPLLTTPSPPERTLIHRRSGSDHNLRRNRPEASVWWLAPAAGGRNLSPRRNSPRWLHKTMGSSSRVCFSRSRSSRHARHGADAGGAAQQVAQSLMFVVDARAPTEQLQSKLARLLSSSSGDSS